MDVLHMEWLLYYCRCLFSVLELDSRYNWQVMAPNTPCNLFLMSHLFVLTCITWKLQVIYGCSGDRMTAVQLETFFVRFRVAWEIWLESYGPRHASVMCMCVYCKPVHTSLYGAQVHITTKLTYLMNAHYMPNDSFTVYANIKMTDRCYCTSLWECCQATKKEHKPRVKILCKN